MKLIRPITYAETQLISSTATETYATWLIGTTYTLAQRVQYGTRIYESLVAGNVGFQPDTNPTKWLDYSPDNKHAMFDTQVSTQTTRTTSLTTVVKPGVNFNSLAFLNILGTTLNVTIQEGIAGSTVYSKSISLDDTIIIDLYTYFFEPYDFKTEVVLTDIPPYASGTVTTTLTASTGNPVAIGSFVAGTVYTLGGTQYGATVGIKDYSVKTTDIYGTTTFVQRAFSKRMDATVYVDAPTLNFNYKLLSDMRAVPAVWIGSDSEALKPLIVFGYYRDFNVNIQYPTYSLCTLSIEGLT
jgi:hypothetical protein